MNYEDKEKNIEIENMYVLHQAGSIMSPRLIILPAWCSTRESKYLTVKKNYVQCAKRIVRNFFLLSKFLNFFCAIII